MVGGLSGRRREERLGGERREGVGKIDGRVGREKTGRDEAVDGGGGGGGGKYY